jgi:uncharacterized membrane protein YkoI
MRVKKLVLAALAVSVGAISGSALALQTVPGNGDPLPMSVRSAIQAARISLPAAILKAEKQTGGKAIEAKLYAAAGGPVYLISLEDPAGPGVIDVKVDAKNGLVFGGPEKMHIEDASRPGGV